MGQHPNKIQVQTKKGQTGYGSMTFTWSALHAAPGDEIIWFSENGPFTLVFPDRSPFTGNPHRISAEHKTDTPQETENKDKMVLGPFVTPPLTVAAGASVYGIYYYAVALAAGADVFIDSGCPSVVID